MRVRLVVAGVVAMLAIAVVGVLDHQHKNAVLYSLREAPWYCANERSRCEEARHAAAVEDRWNAREAGYMASLVLVGAATCLLFAGAVQRQRLHGRVSS